MSSLSSLSLIPYPSSSNLNITAPQVTCLCSLFFSPAWLDKVHFAFFLSWSTFNLSSNGRKCDKRRIVKWKPFEKRCESSGFENGFWRQASFSSFLCLHSLHSMSSLTLFHSLSLSYEEWTLSHSLNSFHEYLLSSFPVTVHWLTDFTDYVITRFFYALPFIS